MSQVDVSLDTALGATRRDTSNRLYKPLSDTSERHVPTGRHVRWTCRTARPTDTSDATPLPHVVGACVCDTSHGSTPLTVTQFHAYLRA